MLGGSTPSKVLIRAVGPTLGTAPFNVPGVMADPTLEVFRGTAKINTNNDWSTPVGTGTATAAQLSAAFTQVGAFALPADSKDAALLVTLAPGSYTVQVGGANSAAGTALVEVYEVP